MLGLKLIPVSEMDSCVYIDQGLNTSLANKNCGLCVGDGVTVWKLHWE